jgi:NADPH:quinone reductase-like Zn-dependent oxidoreductase
LKAVVYRRYGPPDVLSVEDIEKPTPRDDEVLLRVHAASINAADRVLLRGKPSVIRLGMGLSKPRRQVLGFDVAGRVEAVGQGVEAFKPDIGRSGHVRGAAGEGIRR